MNTIDLVAELKRIKKQYQKGEISYDKANAQITLLLDTHGFPITKKVN